jgi:hypothetical protein
MSMVNLERRETRVIQSIAPDVDVMMRLVVEACRTPQTMKNLLKQFPLGQLTRTAAWYLIGEGIAETGPRMTITTKPEVGHILFAHS